MVQNVLYSNEINVSLNEANSLLNSIHKWKIIVIKNLKLNIKQHAFLNNPQLPN
jgi:hypothetical protein